MRDAVSNDPVPVSLLRRVLDEVLADERFADRRRISTVVLAEYIQTQIATGERDIDRLKAAAFRRLTGA
ncbi:MAG: hypothetical protein JOY90_03980 [Bradyrhizobium sp.]|uniref:hypothetical protein n=1 Tax=Bradyrhizobium sp. TaxID=376 RepID=UPI001D86308C|nr:hypothetical protein [Bradyrhizobium sp.]MBV9559608.1 hypothetical protein [Bradyrhizobium sp.]